MRIERRELLQAAIDRETNGDPAEMGEKAERYSFCNAHSQLRQRVGAGCELAERHAHDHDQPDNTDRHHCKPNRR
jgi:hypothetical protein